MHLCFVIFQLVFTHLASIVSATNTCYTCSIYDFYKGETLCANPGSCESDLCYTYVSSTGTPIMLSGCVERGARLPRGTNSSHLFCHAHGSVAICFCPAQLAVSITTTPSTPHPNALPSLYQHQIFCNRHFNQSALVGNLVKFHEFEDIAKRTTDITGEYIRKRLTQMNLGDIPEVFQGTIFNGCASHTSLLAVACIAYRIGTSCLL